MINGQSEFPLEPASENSLNHSPPYSADMGNYDPSLGDFNCCLDTIASTTVAFCIEF